MKSAERYIKYLEAELDEFMVATVDLRAFLNAGDVVTVSTPGRRGSLTFTMDRFRKLCERQAERGAA